MMTCVFCDLIASDDVTWIAREEKAVAFRALPEDELPVGQMTRPHFGLASIPHTHWTAIRKRY